MNKEGFQSVPFIQTNRYFTHCKAANFGKPPNPSTPWKFNIAPENGWLEDEFPFGIPYFQGLC